MRSLSREREGLRPSPSYAVRRDRWEERLRESGIPTCSPVSTEVALVVDVPAIPLPKCASMALLRSCCCWNSVRKGSFACGIYTLIYYTILVAAGLCHMSSAFRSSVRFTLSMFLLSCSGLCVGGSVLLLVGLFLDNRILLLPWLTIISVTTLVDIVLSLYLIVDLPVNPFVVTMYVIDYILCGVNVYSILCVLSQYQEYVVRRRCVLGDTETPSTQFPALTRYISGFDRAVTCRGAQTHADSQLPTKKSAFQAGIPPVSESFTTVQEIPEKPVSTSQVPSPALPQRSSSQTLMYGEASTASTMPKEEESSLNPSDEGEGQKTGTMPTLSPALRNTETEAPTAQAAEAQERPSQHCTVVDTTSRTTIQ